MIINANSQTDTDQRPLSCSSTHLIYNYTLLILINDSGLKLLRLLVYLILPSTESSLGKAVTST